MRGSFARIVNVEQCYKDWHKVRAPWDDLVQKQAEITGMKLQQENEEKKYSDSSPPIITEDIYLYFLALIIKFYKDFPSALLITVTTPLTIIPLIRLIAATKIKW